MNSKHSQCVTNSHRLHEDLCENENIVQVPITVLETHGCNRNMKKKKKTKNQLNGCD